MEIERLRKRLRYCYVSIGFLVFVSAGSCFFGLMRDAQAAEDRLQFLLTKVSLKECEVEARKQKEFALQANLEAEIQKRFGEEAYRKMVEAQNKSK